MITSPFGPDDLKTIDETLKLISELIPFIQKAEVCGHNCDEWKRELEDKRDKLERYKSEFFKKGKPLWAQG